MNITDRKLSTADVIALGEIIQAAASELKVMRMIDGQVFEGTARSVTDEAGLIHREQFDIRDAYLQVSNNFVQMYWPIADLMVEQPEGLFHAER
jgi:hypothetical protein